MKLILDFDDVICNNTVQLKERMYFCIEEVGISREIAEKYYNELREKEFSLKYFLSSLFIREKIQNISSEEIYEKIMGECKNFLNTELLEIIKKIGKSNCYLVTNGEREFQEDKINRTEVRDLFKEIYIVPGTKKEIIEKICLENKGEQILFIDDREKYFNDLDMEKCLNLKTILYDENRLNKLKLEINKM